MKPVRIGCSGWVYKDWRGAFYPEKLPQRLWLEHYSSVYDTVEINNTFYRLPTEAAVKGWAEQTPDGFEFAVKGGRYTTHIKRLLSFDKYSTRFFKALEPLEKTGKLAVVLWQLPPNFKQDLERLETALDVLDNRPGAPLLRVPQRDVVCEGHLRPPTRARRGAGDRRRSALSVRDARGDGLVGVRPLPPRRTWHPRRVHAGRDRHLAPAHRRLAAQDGRLRLLQQRLRRLRA